MGRWLRFLRQGVLLAAAIPLLAGCGATSSVEPPGDGLRLRLAAGWVQGSSDAATGTRHWKGVPYAAPPVGDRRWRPPAEPAPWPGVRDATAFAPACVQTGRLYGPGFNNRYDATIGASLGRTVGSEDCLYLNVWRPATDARRLPVIVFVHGGSNVTGYTADPVYDGAVLARRANAVVVAVAYRLGVFGFLDAAVLKTGDPATDSGNFALLDIETALAFVQRDVEAFGGDPARVTLMGQSAGAVNVYALLVSPRVVEREQPLFHRVVAMSGGLSTAATLPPGAIAGVQPRATWQGRGSALVLEALLAAGTAADEAGARKWVESHTPAEVAGHLRGLPPDLLLEVVRTRLARRGMAASNPIPDGHVVPPDPMAAIRAGRYVRVPVLAGKTRDEAKLFPQLFALRPDLGGLSGRLLDDADVFAILLGYDPEGPPTTRIERWVPAAYLPADAPATGFDARAAALDRLWFDAIRRDVLDALRSQQAEVYAYRFDWDELPPPFDRIFGAAHTFDLPFVFGNFGPSLHANVSFTAANAPGRLALSDRMIASLAAFARSGDPRSMDDARDDVGWPAWPGERVFDADSQNLRISVR